jgi:hypothetical protein
MIRIYINILSVRQMCHEHDLFFSVRFPIEFKVAIKFIVKFFEDSK